MVAAVADVPLDGCRGGAPGLGSKATHRRREVRILRRLRQPTFLQTHELEDFAQATGVGEAGNLALMQLGADGSTVGEGERAGSCLACDTCPVVPSDAPLTREAGLQVLPVETSSDGCEKG